MRAEMIIGLVGAKRSGKSEVSNHLVEEYGFQRLRFADGLKEMLKTLGLTDEQIDGAHKEEPLPFLCGRTPRHAMQTLGTEWGRVLIGGDLWVNACQQRLLRACSGRKKARVVIDDVRFPNEVRMIQELGGMLWKVRRPDVEPPTPSAIKLKLFDWGILRAPHLHPSERHWRSIKTDVEIINDLDLDHLYGRVDGLAQQARLGKR